MLSIFIKEINSFFASLIGYLVVGIFLLTTGVMLWWFPAGSSILAGNYATMDTLFSYAAPLLFLLLIPAVTMSTFAEETQSGTIELLVTRPISDWQIVAGKYFACIVLVLFSLLPTFIYFFSVWQLGEPPGNLDKGGIMGSYIGLFFLAASFVAIGLFASSLTKNQIVSFILAVVLCILFYKTFDAISQLPIFFAKSDDIIQSFGIESHYTSMSRGVIDSRDLIYFLSVIALFLSATVLSLGRRKW